MYGDFHYCVSFRLESFLEFLCGNFLLWWYTLEFLFQYVIKKLNLKHASSRERKAAEQEAQLLSQLKHPNIVAYRESWQGEDGLLYIVMGFCEGGDLYHRLKEQKGKLLPENQVVEWFVQIAMALQVKENVALSF